MRRMFFRRSIAMLVPTVLILGVFIFGACSGATLEEEELSEVFSDAILLETLKDGRYDKTLFEAQLAGVDLSGQMRQFARGVEVVTNYLMTQEEYKEWLKRDSVPPDLLDESGLVRLNTSPEFGIAFLLDGETVAFSSSVLVDALAPIPGIKLARIVLLPDTSVEDTWRREILFEGDFSALPIFGQLTNDRNPQIISWRRPQEKLILAPQNASYQRVDLKNLGSDDIGSVVVYLRNVEGLMTFAVGHLAYIQPDGPTFFFDGLFTKRDFGTPVFMLRDGELELAGVLIGDEAGVGFAVGLEAAPGGGIR